MTTTADAVPVVSGPTASGPMASDPTVSGPMVSGPIIDTGRRYHPSHSIWRRTIAEEIARLSEVLNEADTAGPPYADDDYRRQYGGYMAHAREELEQAWGETHPHQRE